MSYVENRVRVRDYGSIQPRDPRLVLVPGVRGRPRLLHHTAAAPLAEMSAACELATGTPLLVVSGWRRHRWKSREQYEQRLVRTYGSVREGRRWLAYDSPHETGLAFDLGSGGLWPTRATVAKQRKTRVHQWLVGHAHEFGVTPYKVEPWHWEVRVPREVWESLPA